MRASADSDSTRCCPATSKIPASSKLNNYPAFLEHLFDAGRRTADAWWKEHGAALGKSSTVNLQNLLQANLMSDFIHRQQVEALAKEGRAATVS